CFQEPSKRRHFFPSCLDHLDKRMRKQRRSSGSEIVEQGFERLLPSLLGQETGCVVKATLDIPANRFQVILSLAKPPRRFSFPLAANKSSGLLRPPLRRPRFHSPASWQTPQVYTRTHLPRQYSQAEAC